MPDIFGVAVATVTPFGPGGNIDYSFIERHLELLQAEGVHGIVPVGTNGEFPSLTLDEKEKIIEVAAAARGDMFLIAGCGSCSLPEVLELVAFAQDAGADAALVVPPFYYSDVDERGVAGFFMKVLAGVDLPILLYHIPMYTGVGISDAIIEALIDFPNLAGIKDSGGDINRSIELVEKYPQLEIFGGSDSQMGEALAAGAAGVISGAANAFPRLAREVWDAHKLGGDSREAGERMTAVRKVLTDFPWIAATKTALSLRGLPQTFVRPPLIDLPRDQKVELEARLSEHLF